MTLVGDGEKRFVGLGGFCVGGCVVLQCMVGWVVLGFSGRPCIKPHFGLRSP